VDQFDSFSKSAIYKWLFLSHRETVLLAEVLIREGNREEAENREKAGGKDMFK